MIVVGRLSKEAKVSDTNKSAARSLAVNRYNGKEEITDWFRLRATATPWNGWLLHRKDLW